MKNTRALLLLVLPLTLWNCAFPKLEIEEDKTAGDGLGGAGDGNGGTQQLTECPEDAWDHDADPASACDPKSPCDSGQHILSSGSPTSDRTCETCADGTFSTTRNAPSCSPWSCSGWEREDAGTTTSDAKCGNGIRQLGTTGNDFARSIALDEGGNVYVAGFTGGDLSGINASGYDVYVRKYDTSGIPLWTKQFGTGGNDYAHGVAVDAIGNVYVAGYTGGDLAGINAGVSDAYVRKYDTSGTPLWTQQFGTAGNDYARAVALDAGGNVYVAGYTDGDLAGASAGGNDAYVRKFDSSGTPLWTEQFGTSGGDDANAVVVDASGNVYVTGTTDGDLSGINASGYDAYVRKYDTSGTPLWTQQFGTGGNDYAHGIAVDAIGNVYVAGYTGGDLAGINAGVSDAYVRKYDTSGTPQWTQQFGTAGNDYARAVALDAGSNVYVAGYTDGALAGISAGFKDAYVLKYDTSGIPLWTEQIGTSGGDDANAVVVDASGNVYVTGTTDGDLSGTNAGGSDAYVLQIQQL